MRIKVSALAVALLVGAAMAPTAQAELVGEFDVSLKNFKRAYNGYTTIMDGRVYDTTGAPPAQLRSAQIRFPRGATIRSTYIHGKLLCDTRVLEVTQNAAFCRGAQFASGTMVIDARPAFPDALTTKVNLFLGPPVVSDINQGSIGRVVVLVQGTAAFPTQVLYGSVFRDKKKPYSFRMELPTAVKPTNPATKVGLAELHLVAPGLTTRKTDARGRRGKKIFWTGLPRCTRKTNVRFRIDYQFVGATPIVRQRALKCSKFLKNPKTKGKGAI